jgi:hypothetical protein
MLKFDCHLISECLARDEFCWVFGARVSAA